MPRGKPRGIFKPTTTHYARPFVRDLWELPTTSSRSKVTYWVTLAFLVGSIFVTESPASWLLHPNQAEASFGELDPCD